MPSVEGCKRWSCALKMQAQLGAVLVEQDSRKAARTSRRSDPRDHRTHSALPELPLPWVRGPQWLSAPGALAAVQHVAATGRCVGTNCGRGRDEVGDRPIGRCLDVRMTDRTGVVTTIVCLFITIQRVA